MLTCAFAGDSTAEVLQAVAKAEFEFPPIVELSAPAKEFVKRCLQKDPKTR